MFKEYKFGPYRQKIKDLMDKRLKLKARIRYHKKQSNYHLDKINLINSKTIISVEKELNLYIVKAGNNPNP